MFTNLAKTKKDLRQLSAEANLHPAANHNIRKVNCQCTEVIQATPTEHASYKQNSDMELMCMKACGK